MPIAARDPRKQTVFSDLLPEIDENGISGVLFCEMTQDLVYYVNWSVKQRWNICFYCVSAKKTLKKFL